MKWLIIALSGAAVLAWAVLDYDQSHEVKEAKPSAAMAPDVTMPLLHGEGTATLSDYRGKVVLFNIWASWCGPCISEFPLLIQLAHEFPERLVVITLSADNKKRPARQFIDRLDKQLEHSVYAKNIIYGWDEKRHITQNIFQSFFYPETILINPKGEMFYKISGEMSLADFNSIRVVVDKLPPLP